MAKRKTYTTTEREYRKEAADGVRLMRLFIRQGMNQLKHGDCATAYSSTLAAHQGQDRALTAMKKAQHWGPRGEARINLIRATDKLKFAFKKKCVR